MKKYIAAAAALGVLILSMSQPSAAASKDVVIAEPQHGIGYLPLYVAIKKGFFEEEQLTIDLHQEFAAVEVRYRMKNTGGQVDTF